MNWRPIVAGLVATGVAGIDPWLTVRGHLLTAALVVGFGCRWCYELGRGR